MILLSALTACTTQHADEPTPPTDAVALAERAFAEIDEQSHQARVRVIAEHRRIFKRLLSDSVGESEETRLLRQSQFALWERTLLPALLHYRNQADKLEYVRTHAEVLRAVLVPEIKAGKSRLGTISPYLQEPLMADYEKDGNEKIAHSRERVAFLQREIERWEASFTSGRLDYRLPETVNESDTPAPSPPDEPVKTHPDNP